MLFGYKVFKNGFVFIMAQYKVALKVMCLSEKMPKMQNFLCAGASWFALSVLPCTYLESLFFYVVVVNSLHLFRMSLACLLVAVNYKYTTL